MHVASGFMLSHGDRVWNAYCLLQGYRSKTYIAREKPVQVTLKYGEHNYEKIKRKKWSCQWPNALIAINSPKMANYTKL